MQLRAPSLLLPFSAHLTKNSCVNRTNQAAPESISSRQNFPFPQRTTKARSGIGGAVSGSAWPTHGCTRVETGIMLPAWSFSDKASQVGWEGGGGREVLWDDAAWAAGLTTGYWGTYLRYFVVQL